MREQVEALLRDVWIDAPGADLRKEDLKKAVEVAAIVGELARVRKDGMILVDAAAGKGYVGLAAARLLGPIRVVAIDANARLLELAPKEIECRAGRVEDRALWPDEPDAIAALHACGPASDAIIDAAIATRARRLFLVPCCTRDSTAADRRADEAGVPRHAPVRRAFVEAIVAAERTLRLEAAGWETEVVELVPKTVTPYNLLFRARRVGEPGRMRAATERQTRLLR
jgi:threonine dehydrogenase-like Zn-dependent dehydrogenase